VHPTGLKDRQHSVLMQLTTPMAVTLFHCCHPWLVDLCFLENASFRQTSEVAPSSYTHKSKLAHSQNPFQTAHEICNLSNGHFSGSLG